jgi:hypothetical protein
MYLIRIIIIIINILLLHSNYIYAVHSQLSVIFSEYTRINKKYQNIMVIYIIYTFVYVTGRVRKSDNVHIT